MNNLTARFAGASRELKLFVAASLVFGVAYSLVDSTFNNFLNETYALNGFQRSFLELPRELPGFLVVFVAALFSFLCNRRLGVLSLLFVAAGILLVGFAAPSYAVMVVWLFVYSLGQHLLMPVTATIGMELAAAGATGQRLGQLNAVRNFATILGSFLVLLGFRYLGLTFKITYALAAVAFVLAAVLMFNMRPDRNRQTRTFLKLHREYRLYYVLAVLYGSRKQIFITFAPWVIVTIFKQPTQTLATLLTVGGIIGIIFQPLLGKAVDRLGERAVLAAEAVVVVIVCLGYALSRALFSENVAFLIVCAGYLLDQFSLSVNMARSTYMKKIALRPADVQPALSTGVSIDHAFSISIALLGGVIWNTFGYQYVFLLGVGIAVLNFFAALRIRVPASATPTTPQLAPEVGQD